MSEQENTQEQEVIQEETNEIEVAIRAAFDEAVADESDEDTIKMQMIAAGATFKNVTRLYNAFMIDAGFAISKEDRSKAVDDTLEGLELDTEEKFNEAVEALVEAVKGATERSAAALVRSYAKKNELDVFVKPKGAGGSKSGFATTFYAWLVEASRTPAEVKAYVNGEGDHAETSGNVKKHASHYLAVAAMAEKIHAA